MNSDRVNRWLTLGANFGVLIGIILLVIELDQNRDMIRAQTRNEISNQVVERLDRQGTDIQLANLKRRAERSEELSDDEEMQVYLLSVGRNRSWENIHYQYRQGMFDEQEFAAERNAWGQIIGRDKSFLRYWCPGRSTYSPEFVAELENLFDGTGCTPAHSEWRNDR